MDDEHGGGWWWAANRSHGAPPEELVAHVDEWCQAEPLAPTPASSAGDVLVFTAGLAALVMLDVVTGGLVSTLASIPGGPPSSGDAYDGPPLVIPADLHYTAAPAFGGDGRVACTRCQRRVLYASMALNEHGYFCASCGPSRPL